MEYWDLCRCVLLILLLAFYLFRSLTYSFKKISSVKLLVQREFCGACRKGFVYLSRFFLVGVMTSFKKWDSKCESTFSAFSSGLLWSLSDVCFEDPSSCLSTLPGGSMCVVSYYVIRWKTMMTLGLFSGYSFISVADFKHLNNSLSFFELKNLLQKVYLIVSSLHSEFVLFPFSWTIFQFFFLIFNFRAF